MEFIIIIGLILFNGILSMSEIALVSVRKSKLETDAKKGNKSAQIALNLIKEPDKFFSTIQIGITLIGIFTGLYSGEVFAYDLAETIQKIPLLSSYALTIANFVIVILVTYLTLVFGELVPKRLGMAIAYKVAKVVAKPMIVISAIVSPFVWLLSKSTTLVMKLFGDSVAYENTVTEDEIKAIVKEGYQSGEVLEVEHDIVERVFSLGDRDVKSIMTHRSEMIWLDITNNREQVNKKVAANLFSTYPVISDSIDNIEGVVYLKDLFKYIDSPDFSLLKILNPIHYISENTNVYNALEQLKTAHVKYGIVVDEFGATQGIITFEDVMNALIGQVYEYGDNNEIVERESGGWLVDGQISFYDFLEYFELEYLYAEYDYNTLSGLILDLLKRVPETGERLRWHSFELEIVDLDGVRIDKVLVNKIK